MQTIKKYTAIRDRIAKRKRAFISIKEKNEIIYSLTTGLKDSVLEYKRKKNESAIQAHSIVVND